jgi:hypothetical protein
MFDGLSNHKASAITLVVANLLPLYGVFFLGWDAFSIVALYWAENLVIGAINVLKMFVCNAILAVFAGAFFAFHYGFFCYIHGIFVLSLFGHDSWITSPIHELREFSRLFSEQHLWWAIAALAASHLFSFFANYIGGGEFRRTSVPELMQQPYGRVVVLHLAILFGGWIVMGLGSTWGVLLLLIAGKTILDLKLHLREHERSQKSEAQPLAA